MKTVTLGRTGITVSKNGFGALPIQRITRDEAAKLLRKAYDGGITLFDTARAYSDSEEKIGYAMSDIRNHIYITTKTAAQNAEEFWKDLETSLTLLKTDHVDVYQFHNPSFCPKPGDESGLYEAALKAREQGKIRFIGITNHRLKVAHEAIESGNFETLQFPFCYLATEKDLELVELCREHDMGFIAMKGLSGGLLNNAEACYAFMHIWTAPFRKASRRSSATGSRSNMTRKPPSPSTGCGSCPTCFTRRTFPRCRSSSATA